MNMLLWSLLIKRFDISYKSGSRILVEQRFDLFTITGIVHRDYVADNDRKKGKDII